MKKKIIIELDVVKGEVILENPDDMTNFEVIGLLEYSKLTVAGDMGEELE